VTKIPQQNFTQIIYGLYAAAPLFGITAIAAVVLNYMKREEVQGSWLETHYRWQIQTFWISFFGIVVSGSLAYFGIGWLILFVTSVWYIYRIAKGWLWLLDNKPMLTS
jgi:uncharacterized membrane protein